MQWFKKTWQTCTLYSCNFQSFCLKRSPITNFMWLISIQTTFFKGPEWPRDTQRHNQKSRSLSFVHAGLSSNISATVCCRLCHSHHTTPPTMPGPKRYRINACQGRVKEIIHSENDGSDSVGYRGRASVSESWVITLLWKQSKIQRATWSSGCRYNPLLSVLDVISQLYLSVQTSAWIKCEPCLILW